MLMGMVIYNDFERGWRNEYSKSSFDEYDYI